MPKMAKTDKEVIEDYQKTIASIIQLMNTLQKVFESSVVSIVKAANLIGEVDARPDGGGLRNQEAVAESQEAELHD
jgi:Asp-tRNA(Asn)/Glu-tRNA(Gln) amidotransferase C subunit